MDDVMHRSYVTAYESVHQARAGRDVGAWLFRITYNACVDALRPRQRSGTTVTADTDAPDDVRAALAGLPVSQRVAIVLIDGEGFSKPEVAEILGVDPDKIASRLGRARTALRNALPTSPDAAKPSVREAVEALPIPDHDPEFWAALLGHLNPEPESSPEPVEAVGSASARHLAIDPKTSIVPSSLRRMSNALLLVLALAAAVLVLVSGLLLVQNRSDSGMAPTGGADHQALAVAAPPAKLVA